MHLEGEAQRRQMVELDLQQARYEASLAERRYAACDPDNRLIAAQLEKSWEATLRRVEACEARLNEKCARTPPCLISPAWLTISKRLGMPQTLICGSGIGCCERW